MASHSASLAAIIALVSFLYTSFRQRKIEKSSMYQQLELASIDLIRWETANMKTILKVREAYEKGNMNISAEDEELIEARYFQTLNLFELCISSARARTLPEKVFGSWLPWIYEFSNEPGFKDIWSEIKTNYVPECREIIDSAIENQENKFIEKICNLKRNFIQKKYKLKYKEWKKNDTE
jgi:hypothetical protein